MPLGLKGDVVAQSSLKSYLLMAVPALLALASIHCDPSFRRSEMNPRKEAIYTYASSLCETDENASVMSMGPMGAPASHPARLKQPFPTRAEMEAAIGKADSETVQKVRYIVEGGLGREEEEDNLTLTWWEKDSTWEVYRDHGMVKPGHREIITAWFGPEGRLKKLYIMHPYGSEFIGRHSSFWRWYS